MTVGMRHAVLGLALALAGVSCADATGGPTATTPAAGAVRFPVTSWPIDPGDTEHEIGNSGGEFQQYGAGSAYFHKGIDLVDDDAPDGPWVRSVVEGVPRLTVPGAGSLYNLVEIDTPSGASYRYNHLDFNSIQQAVRDAAVAGTALPARSRMARLVTWTACSYHHLHYGVSDGSGPQDPIYTVTPRDDTDPPQIDRIFVMPNESNDEFPRGPANSQTGVDAIWGDVDVVARVHDLQFSTHRTGVMEIGWHVEAENGTVAKAPRTIRFLDIPADPDTANMFRDSTTFDSSSAYCSTEEYYYVVTNVDAAGAITADADGFWDTTRFPNGIYTIVVTASDPSGNEASLTKTVEVRN